MQDLDAALPQIEKYKDHLVAVGEVRMLMWYHNVILIHYKESPEGLGSGGPSDVVAQWLAASFCKRLTWG